MGEMYGEKFNMGLVVIVIMNCLLFAGCTRGAGHHSEEIKSTLKVIYPTEEAFFRQYGDLFRMSHENIDFEVIRTSSLSNNGRDRTYEEALDELVKNEQPDILILDTATFKTYISEGKLLELDSLILKDNYPLEGIYPGLIDLLKELGGNKLYGLAPTFYGTALFYNKGLFSKYGIEQPHDGMTWQDVLDLARRFPTDGDEGFRVYGFGNDYPMTVMNYPMSVGNLVDLIANTEGLMSVDPNTLKLTVDTDSWKKVYRLAIEAEKSGVIYNPKDAGFTGGSIEEYYRSQAFLMGRVAMIIGDPYTSQNAKLARDILKDDKPIDMGIVSGPVNSSDPETTLTASVDEIFAIHGNSTNKDAAWEFLKFVNGEDYARVKSKSMNGTLLSRMGFNEEYGGQSLDVFYALKPKINPNHMNSDKIPNAFYVQLQSIVSGELSQVQEGNKSLDEAIKTIQAEGQVTLDRVLKIGKQ